MRIVGIVNELRVSGSWLHVKVGDKRDGDGEVHLHDMEFSVRSTPENQQRFRIRSEIAIELTLEVA